MTKLEMYQKHGFFLLEDLVPRLEIAAILERMEDYVRERRPRPPGFAIQIEPRVERGEVQMADPMTAVRKIKGPVPGDDLLTALVLKPQLVEAMHLTLGPNLKLFRADFLMKPPRVGSAKGVHQDAPYWPLDPYESASCWIALDNATLANGCMTVIPGSHRRGALPHVRVTDDFVIPVEQYREADLVPVEMKAGTGLVFKKAAASVRRPAPPPARRRSGLG
jgi:hypothetical protein